MHPAIFLLVIPILIQSEKKPVFREQSIDDAIEIGYGLALGDVDGDKRTDILLADKKQIVWYRNGDWKKFVMAQDLTELDNVCIAARDIDGDGKVEVAVGAQWNPSETSDTTRSGSVHYLIRPADPTTTWSSVNLRHEPTVHRMRWMVTGGKPYLVVLPLHGRNNKGGEGAGVKVYAYEFPEDVNTEWKLNLLSDDMHMTHNFAIEEGAANTSLYVAGKEGVRIVSGANGNKMSSGIIDGLTYGAGEVKHENGTIATIEPMHGNAVVVYDLKRNAARTVVDTTLREGHALGIADFQQNGQQQVVAGWRNPDKEGQVGIRIYSKDGKGKWQAEWLDKNGMACEDLQIADLNGDGRQDIIASGRSTKNVKIYWNESK